MFSEEIRNQLERKILPFWMGLKDETYGGYYGGVDNHLIVNRMADKGCILNSRILWTFSTAARQLNSAEYRQYADHAMDFFRKFEDPVNGGVYWSVTYDGLGKLPWMKDHFKSVTLTHAYTCKYAIGSFGSYSTWVPAEGENGKMIGFVRDVTTDQPIPSSAYDISNITITEAFAPLIGLNLTMKNSLSLKAEYRKQRNLALNVTSVQITEGHTSEFVIGGGYTIKDLSFTTKNKDGAQKKVSNDLKLQVDVSYKDVKMLLRKVPAATRDEFNQLDRGITQASSGNKVFAIKISADYVLSQKINLQLFYDHQGTTPLISSSYPVKADNVGLNIKLMLTR